MWAKTAGEFYRKNKGKYESFSDVLKSPALKEYYNAKMNGKKDGKKSGKKGGIKYGMNGGAPTEPPLGGAPVESIGGAPEVGNVEMPQTEGGNVEMPQTEGAPIVQPLVGGRKKKRTSKKKSASKKTQKKRSYMW